MPIHKSTTHQEGSSDAQRIPLTNATEGWRAVLTRATALAVAAVATAGPATLVRAYKGKQQADANAATTPASCGIFVHRA